MVAEGDGEEGKKRDEQCVDYVCHILRHDNKHVESVWPTDTYSNNSTFFPSLPPLSLSIQEKGLEGSKGGWGLWDMLTQANEKEGKRGGNTKRHTQRKRETSKS